MCSSDLALVGAVLPGLTIKAAKVRGVESSGMLCSAKELGIAEDAGGLMVLPVDAQIGADVRHVLDLNDCVFDSKPTPNRGDCLSVRGLAREVAALCGERLTAVSQAPVPTAHDSRPVISLEAPHACPLYYGRLLHGVNARAATPEWMARRLRRSGVRTISAIVDVTNYVMLELGQPLHAFDAAKLRGGIHVRYARAGEQLTLLNGETRTLTPSFLVIADDTQALALAGIMGGAYSAVGDETRDILLESAYFDPAAIAGKSRVLGFGSDASYRYERGVNFGGSREAMERATQLILSICGGSAGAVTEAAAALPARLPVNLRYKRVSRVLGVQLSEAQIAAVFTRLGFEYEVVSDGLRVTPPAHRFDIAIEEDLIEEVARIHGYNQMPSTAPVAVAMARTAGETAQSALSLRKALVARDYQEVVTYSFVDRQWESDFCGNDEAIALANPLASHMAVMRSSLIGGLINTVSYNLRNKQSRVRVFEVGRCFLPGSTEPLQPWRIGGAVCGEAVDPQWGIRPARSVDFFDVKGDVEALIGESLQFQPAQHLALHPGKSARVLRSGDTVGWMGELHPRLQAKYDLPCAVLLFELDLAAVMPKNLPRFDSISRFPPVFRDLAMVFDEATPYQSVIDAVHAQKPASVCEFSVFDIYRGTGVENGKKSLAFRMLVQDTQKTMTDAEVDFAVSAIIKILQDQFNAKLR